MMFCTFVVMKNQVNQSGYRCSNFPENLSEELVENMSRHNSSVNNKQMLVFVLFSFNDFPVSSYHVFTSSQEKRKC